MTNITDIIFQDNQLLLPMFGKGICFLIHSSLKRVLRAMLHNEEDYPEASAFKPERFLKNGLPNPSVRDPTSVVFGVGRRQVSTWTNFL